MRFRPINGLGALLRDLRGTMAIETAIVAPVLIALSIGGFEVSSIVARQSELQSAAAEAVAIVMAATPETQTEVDQIEAVIEASADIPEDDVTFELKYRCAMGDLLTATELGELETPCDEKTVSSFIVITMSDSYSPVWTSYGLGHEIEYHVVRSVQMS